MNKKSQITVEYQFPEWELIQSRDKDALSELGLYLKDYIQNIVSKYYSGDDAKDITNESLLRIFDQLDKIINDIDAAHIRSLHESEYGGVEYPIDRKRAFLTRCYYIIKSLMAVSQKKLKKSKLALRELEIEKPSANYREVEKIDNIILNRILRITRETIGKSESDRMIMEMHFNRGLRLVEIATKLNMNYRTVRKKYYRLMEKIRNRLLEEYPDLLKGMNK
jgi:DNA-directed RNA polymerase specialized sigma24 family protein